ncbi:MAG: hypothetical protein ACHQ1G_01820 [Planctomycetota bacterium]
MRGLPLALALIAGTAVAQDAPRYTFHLDGGPHDPQIVSLEGTPESPRPGDLLYVRDNLWITLGEPGEYRFRFAGADPSRLMLGDRVVAVRVFRDADGNIANPLETMSSEEVRALRGLCLLEWDEAILRQAWRLDPLATLTLMCDEREIPALPATLERLCILGNPSAGAPRLAELSALRAFVATDYSGKFDWSALVSPQLRAVVAPGTRPGDLARFPELRMLDLSEARELREAGFVAKTPHLRVLDVRESGVTDLGPLAGHPALVRVVATRAPIARLPTGRLPALSRLLVDGTLVSEEQCEAFRKANPACMLEYQWEDRLRAAVAGCDLLRVTEKRDGDALLEVRGVEEIRDLVATVRIDETRSGWNCHCDGGPFFAFCKGETLVAVVSFHHAEALAFDWPGLGELTPESAEALCEWLARHGVPGPLEEHKENVARDKAWAVRVERSQRILGEETWARVFGARGDEETAAAFASVANTDEGRVRVWFSLLGCHEGGWDSSPFDTDVEMQLLDVAAETLCVAVRGAVADPWTCAGAAQWILGESRWDRLDEATLRETLPALAQSGLAHPRPYSRRRTLIALSKMGGDQAVAALRTALAGVPPRRLDPDERGDSRSGNSKGGGPKEIRAATSDRAVAAYFLAQLGDENSLPEMRDLLGQLQGEDRNLVEKAILLLEGR